MFSILSETKEIPTWFNNFEPTKLYRHPVKSIQWLIYLMQGGLAVCAIFALTSAIFLMGVGTITMGPFLVGATAFVTALVQVVILGIHARSRLAWLLVAAAGIRYFISPLLPLGLIMLWLLEQKDSQEYFAPNLKTKGNENE